MEAGEGAVKVEMHLAHQSKHRFGRSGWRPADAAASAAQRPVRGAACFTQMVLEAGKRLDAGTCRPVIWRFEVTRTLQAREACPSCRVLASTGAPTACPLGGPALLSGAAGRAAASVFLLAKCPLVAALREPATRLAG